MKEDFTLEDILEEQRQVREKERTLPPGAEYVEEPLPEQPEAGPWAGETPAPPPPPYEPEEAPAPTAGPAEAPDVGPVSGPVAEPEPVPPPPPQPEEPEPEPAPSSKKKKKKRKGLFGWRKKVPDFDESEGDTYYGIQLKPIDEYRLDGDAPPLGEEGYKALFDDSQAIDDEVEENFQRLQKERRRRVAEAVQSAGLNEEQVADEFGVVAPMPVTPFAADPYAQQHGLAPEGPGAQGLSDLQRAMLENSETMELKLNVLNSTIELQKIRDAQPVSDEAVDRILASVPHQPAYTEAPATYTEAEPPTYTEAEPPAPYTEAEAPYTETPAAYTEASAPYTEAGSPAYPQQAQPSEATYSEPPTYSEAEPPALYTEVAPPYTEAPEPAYTEAEPPALYTEAEAPYTEAPATYTEAGSPAYPQQAQPSEATYSEPPAYAEVEPPATYAEAETPSVYTEAPLAPYPSAPPPAPAPQGRYREGTATYTVDPASPGETPQPPVRVYGQPPARQAQPPQAAEPTREIPRRQLQEGQAPPRPQPPQAPPPRPVQEVPYVEDVFQYRSRNIPTHIIQADALQSALLSEEESLQQARDAAGGRQAPRRRVRKKPEDLLPPAPPVSDTTESIEDYTGEEDARSIAHELRGEMSSLSLRIMTTGVCTVLLALVSVICRSQFAPGEGSGTWPLAYVILTLVFLVVSVGMCWKTVANGLKGLFAAKATADSGVAVAALAGLVQTVSSLFFRDQLVEGGLHLYAPVVAALLLANLLGKLTMVRRIHSNFRFVTSREEKCGVRVFDDYNTSLKMTKDCVAEKPLIAYQCKAGFLKRFLELSYAPDPSEAASQTVAPLGLIASLLLCVATLLITKDVPAAIGAFSAACCACVAAGNMLSVNLPVSNMCKTVRRAGGMVVGYEAVEAFGDVNAVIADAGELFPTGTVTLDGIKAFGSRVMMEDAIMAASALMHQVGGPLTGVFDQVISENEGMLPQVEKVGYESGAGVVGRVDGKTVYIGNRTLLLNHRLEAPSREEETQYAPGSKNIIYIAIDAEVVALLVLTYAAERRKKNELQRLEDSGISVLVRTTDPNVTVAQVSRLFGVDSASVGILDAQLGEAAHRLMQEPQPRVDAVAATKGRMESLMSLIAACVEQKRTAGMLVAIQTAAVILGFVLVAFLACFGELRQLSVLILFLFQLIWTGIILILPRFRR